MSRTACTHRHALREDRDIHTHTQRERERQRETERQRQTETDRDRQRQTETERENRKQGIREPENQRNNLYHFLKMPLPHKQQIVVRAFRQASSLAIQHIRKIAIQIKKDNPDEFRALLTKCASTSLNSKVSPSTMTEICV